MKSIVQKDSTGCGIASVAAISGQTYVSTKKTAASLGIRVTDASLWSDVKPIRRLLGHLGITVAATHDFRSWDELPDRALLAIKWHQEKSGPAWHWVVFVREKNESYVLDSKKTLRNHRRTDFGRMKPKWFMEVKARGR